MEFTKALYTADEVKQMLESLFAEKKRVRNLALQEQENAQLQVKFKEMEERIYASKIQNEQTQKLLYESRFHAEQLEKGMDYLRGKLEEAKIDKGLLGEELLESQEKNEQFRIDLEQCERIASELQQKLESERVAKEESEKTIQKMEEEMSNLKKEIKNIGDYYQKIQANLGNIGNILTNPQEKETGK